MKGCFTSMLFITLFLVYDLSTNYIVYKIFYNICKMKVYSFEKFRQILIVVCDNEFKIH